MNRWNIPGWLENEVKKRDKTCVYCGIEMLDQILPHVSRRSAATWEHIINDAGIVTRENIARCCVACNSSKGTKDLSVWIQSSYCRKRGINEDTVAEVVRNALKKARDKLTHNDGMPPTPYRPQSITASCGELGMPSATIKIFLVHGDPKRLRTAELSNWTGKAVAGPRSEFEGLVGREESGNSGVYFLTGADPESGKPALYVGEAENIRDRVKVHLEKDFWNQIIFFISKDENLTKAHIRYLEGKLIDQARQANRALVVNGQSSGAKLPESDREDMEVFLEKIYQLLPVLGVELLVRAAGKAATNTEMEMLYCEIKGLQAKGRLTPNGFLVLKGSQAVLKERASALKFPWPLNMRQRLKEEGALSVAEDYLVFTRNEEFSSPSAAAAVVHGGHANGLISWKNRDGKTLKEIETT